MVHFNKKRILFFTIGTSLITVFYLHSFDLGNSGEFQPEWTKLGIRRTLSYVKPGENTIILGQNMTTSSTTAYNKDNGPYLALIFVVSLPAAVERRMEIRETWKKWQISCKMKVLFFLGNPNQNLLKDIEEESKKFQDILVDSHEESYYTLPIKVLKMMKLYISITSPYIDTDAAVPYFIKTDDDIFVNLPALAFYLNSRQNIKFFIGGHLYMFSKPSRNLNSKFYVPHSVWASSFWPNYVAGMFYIISGNLVGSVYKAGLTAPYLPFEDLFITGVVANRALGLELRNIKGIYDLQRKTEKVLNDDEMLRNSIALSSVNRPHTFRTVFARLSIN